MHSSSKIILVTAVIAAIVSFSVARMTAPSAGPAVQNQESTFDRIKRTGLLRCGYIESLPYIKKDPNTGQMSGLSFEYMEALAREMNVRLEWTEPTGYGNYHEGLNSNRYDVLCSVVWQSGVRAQASMLTRPLFYNAMYAAVRDDDHRFDQNLDVMNSPAVTITAIDGDPTQSLRRMRFPLAKELTLPQAADQASVILGVITKKADVTLANCDDIKSFNDHSTTQKIRILEQQPLRLFADTLAVRQGEVELKAMLDSAIEAINNSGEATAIVQKYAPSVKSIMPGYRIGKP